MTKKSLIIIDDNDNDAKRQWKSYDANAVIFNDAAPLVVSLCNGLHDGRDSHHKLGDTDSSLFKLKVDWIKLLLYVIAILLRLPLCL